MWPSGVGKMTVAEAIQDKIKYNLMTNHDSIEVSDKIFGFATPAQKEFNKIFRKQAFDISKKNNIDMIFTFVCAFDMEEDISYLKNLENLFIAGLTAVKEQYGEQIKELFDVDVVIPTKPFPRIKLEDLYIELKNLRVLM